MIKFLDIETTPQYQHLEEAPKALRDLFIQKHHQIIAEHPEYNYAKRLQLIWEQKAPLSAEFGKIICFCMGFVNQEQDGTQIFDSSQYAFGEDEVEILKSIQNFLDTKQQQIYCAHNGLSFDFPFMARRFIINGFKVPETLNVAGKKPWEVKHLIDTKELWKFNQYDSSISLDLLCTILGIESPKGAMTGADVFEEYWVHKNHSGIANYCFKDVYALYQCYEKLKYSLNLL